ncbi:MAG TPA: response regulator, partial [Deltaproteobacteria bacterium]|nr:response regulator [Deltaproteobacteria bacterium]
METENKSHSQGILFVDDEENILRSLKRMFLSEDFEVYTASSGLGGLKILQEYDGIGLIVSDQRMPGMTGVEFLAKARQIRPECLRILLTGYSDINAVADAINQGGAYRYITKPWNDEELIRVVKEAMNIYNLTEENKRLSEVVHQQNEQLKDWNAELEKMVQEQTMELSNQNDELRKLTQHQVSNFRSMISSFASLIELRDQNVRSHSRNVTDLSVRVAKKRGLSPDEVETITIAALLHDIGKIGIPDTMLIKEPSEMNADETLEYRMHPVRGQASIDSIVDLRRAGILVRHHHERFDGKGFPDRLKGNAIPIGARIIAAADFIDRSMGRTKEAKPVEATLIRVEDELGKALDPSLLKYIRIPVEETYCSQTANVAMVEKEFRVDDLQPGMVISRDVKSGTGLLLMNKGVRLGDKHIQILKRYFRVD